MKVRENDKPEISKKFATSEQCHFLSLWIIPVNIIVSNNVMQFPMEEGEKSVNEDNFAMITGREENFSRF